MPQNYPDTSNALERFAAYRQQPAQLPEIEQRRRGEIIGLLKQILEIGREHPHTRDAIFDYAIIAEALRVPKEEFWRRIDEMFLEAGVISAKKKKEICDAVFAPPLM